MTLFLYFMCHHMHLSSLNLQVWQCQGLYKVIYNQNFKGHWSWMNPCWDTTPICISFIAILTLLAINLDIRNTAKRRATWNFISRKVRWCCVRRLNLFCLVFECSKSVCQSVWSGSCWLNRREVFSVYFIRPLRKCSLGHWLNKPCGFDFH